MKKIITLLVISFMTMHLAYSQTEYQLWIYSDGNTSVNELPSLVDIQKTCESLTKSSFLCAVSTEEEINILLNCTNEAEEIVIENSLIGEENYLQRFQSIAKENLPSEAQQALINQDLNEFFIALKISYKIKDYEILALSSDDYETIQGCIFKK